MEIDKSYIVLVQVTVKPEMREEFEQALLHNARESVARDPGCLRFDVSQDVEDPTRWVLHEVYDAPESHAAHRRSPHFLAYDSESSDRQMLCANGRSHRTQNARTITTNYQPQTTNHQPPTTNHQPPTTNRDERADKQKCANFRRDLGQPDDVELGR